MLRSMTGFGGAAGKADAVEYAVEIRSVNNRYFKAISKLPEIWMSAEAEIEKLLRARLNRGTITVTVRMKIPDEKAAYHVNVAALSSYIDQIRPLEVEANPILRIDLGTMMQLPGVCEPPSLEEVVAQTHAGLMELIGEAVDKLVLMRQREGKVLKDDLLTNCDMVEKSLAVVAQRGPGVVVEYQQRLADRVRELTNQGTVNIDADSLAREVAIFADRCDVNEEISRLRGHLQQFVQAINSPEPAGRKLEFIAQEMLREANTIASKSNDVEIARAVVEMKTAIDRIKEQVQNAE